MKPAATPKPKRRHTARIRGTQIEARAKHPASMSGLYRAAAEFNRAFDKVFCARRPWLKRPDGWQFDPLLKPKTPTP